MSASVLEHIVQTTYQPFCPYDPSHKTEHVPSALETVCPVSDLLTYCQDEIQQLRKKITQCISQFYVRPSKQSYTSNAVHHLLN